MDDVDKLTGLSDRQKEILRKIRSEQKEDPYAKTATSQSKAEPLEEITDGKLEEVEKLKAKKTFGDGTITNESILENFTTPNTGKNLDPIHSSNENQDSQQQGARQFVESMHNVDGKGGDEKITDKKLTINGVKIPARLRKILEDTKNTPTSSKSPVKKVNEDEDNGHQSGTLADGDGDLVVEEQTYIGKPASKISNKMTDLNKIQNTSTGDNINYFVNGVEDNGMVIKMNGSYLTILKSNGQHTIIHINDTFFVKDIITNKSWNDMNMEERSEQLQKAHAYSPRFLSKTWEQLPRELREIIKKKDDDSESIHTGELSKLDGIAPSSFQHQSTIGTGKTPATFEGSDVKEKPTPNTGKAPRIDKSIDKLKADLAQLEKYEFKDDEDYNKTQQEQPKKYSEDPKKDTKREYNGLSTPETRIPYSKVENENGSVSDLDKYSINNEQRGSNHYKNPRVISATINRDEAEKLKALVRLIDVTKVKIESRPYKQTAQQSNTGSIRTGQGDMQSLIAREAKNQPSPVPTNTDRKYFDDSGQEVTKEIYDKINDVGKALDRLIDVTNIKDDIHKTLTNKLRKIKSDVEQGAYGSIGGRPNAGVSTNTEMDADKEYEGSSHIDFKEQFKHEEKKPSTTADKKKENANADGGNGLNASGYYNAVYDKKDRIAGQGRDQ